MIFLQIPGQEKLVTDYGVMGIFTLVFIAAIIFLFKFAKTITDARQKETRELYEKLDQKFTKYMDDDRKHMLGVIENNTKAFNDFINHKK